MKYKWNMLRCCGLMVSGSSGPGSSPGRERCVVFLSKTGVKMGTGELNAGVTLRRRGSRGSEMGEFSPLPLFLSPLFSFFSYPSNTSTRLWLYYIITKIHPPFQNPGSAPALVAGWRSWTTGLQNQHPKPVSHASPCYSDIIKLVINPLTPEPAVTDSYTRTVMAL